MGVINRTVGSTLPIPITVNPAATGAPTELYGLKPWASRVDVIGRVAYAAPVLCAFAHSN